MTDTLSRAERSARMRLVRSKNTKPEMTVRRAAHSMGYRYRVHAKLPGSPDLSIRTRRKAIFVHGCFWHGHDCKLGRMPKSRVDFWARKIAANRERDERVQRHYDAEGWGCLILWECQLGDAQELGRAIGGFLDA